MRSVLAAALLITGHCRGSPQGAPANLTKLHAQAAEVQTEPAVPADHGLDPSMDAYVISPSTLFDRLKPLLLQLGFSPRRIDPVEVHDSCRGKGTYDKGVQGCFLAHQGVWAAIKKAGRTALVLESDATTSGAPIDKLKRRLVAAAADARRSQSPRYISVGHCDHLCTLAYFMNPQAAEIGTALDFCKTTQPLDFQIRDDLCHDVKCTWEKGLADVERCADCMGEGLFFQNRTLKGLHNGGKDLIRDGEQRETLFLQRGGAEMTENKLRALRVHLN